MNNLLLFGFGTLIATSVFLFFLYRSTISDIEDLREGLEDARAEIESLKAKQRVNERRFQKMSEPEKLVIVHENYIDNDVDFGGF